MLSGPPPARAAAGGGRPRRAWGGPGLARSEPVLALALVAAALLLRSPALLYSALNFDESMYLLMGAEFARGRLPYTTVCDLKPFGLFALATPVAASPFDPVVTARIVSSVVVGLTAWMLSRAARLLFAAAGRAVGITAGLCYVVFSLATGGTSFQGELFQNAAAAAGLLFLLRGARSGVPPRLGPMCAAGLVLGAGVQVKPTVAFDMLAFLAGYFILTTPGWRGLGRHLRANLPPMLVLGAASLVPTLLVVLLYAAAGELDAWTAANVRVHLERYAPRYPFEAEPALRAMWEQAPLWLAGAAALALSRRLAPDGAERRAVAFLGAWIVAVGACIAFLRMSSDHYFLQFLPPLSLLAGLAVGRGLLARVPDRRAAGLTLVALAVWGVAKSPLAHSAYVLWDRLRGEAWAGDAPRRIAADLGPALRPGDAVYVLGFQPVVYVLTGAAIPTRYAFTGLPHLSVPGRDGCPWTEPAEELRRVLDARPRFVVVERGAFLAEMPPHLRRILEERLGRDYRLRRSFEAHEVHAHYPFERFVMNAGAAADVYELRDGEEKPSSASALPAAPDQRPRSAGP